MPHDVNGRILQVGDTVNVPCKVLSVSPGEFCTLTVETVHPMPGNGMKSTFAALNARMVEWVESPDEPKPFVDPSPPPVAEYAGE